MKGESGAYLVTVCFVVVLRSKGFDVIVIEIDIKGLTVLFIITSRI